MHLINIWQGPKHAFETGIKKFRSWQIPFKTDWNNAVKNVLSVLCTSLFVLLGFISHKTEHLLQVMKLQENIEFI